MECIDDHNANEALEEVTLGGDGAEHAAAVLRPPTVCLVGPGRRWGGPEPALALRTAPRRPQVIEESVLKHSFLNQDADDLEFRFSEKIKYKYRLQDPRLIYQ